MIVFPAVIAMLSMISLRVIAALQNVELPSLSNNLLKQQFFVVSLQANK